jgi:hypothetical protein
LSSSASANIAYSPFGLFLTGEKKTMNSGRTTYTGTISPLTYGLSFRAALGIEASVSMGLKFQYKKEE